MAIKTASQLENQVAVRNAVKTVAQYVLYVLNVLFSLFVILLIGNPFMVELGDGGDHSSNPAAITIGLVWLTIITISFYLRKKNPIAERSFWYASIGVPLLANFAIELSDDYRFGYHDPVDTLMQYSSVLTTFLVFVICILIVELLVRHRKAK